MKNYYAFCDHFDYVIVFFDNYRCIKNVFAKLTYKISNIIL